MESRDAHLTRRTACAPINSSKMRSSAFGGYKTLVLRPWTEDVNWWLRANAGCSDAGQHQQLPKRQAEQQGSKNHEDDPHGFKPKALSDGRNQEHSGEENCDPHILVSRFSGFSALSAIS